MRVRLCVVAVFVLVGGCGEESERPVGDPAASATPPPPPGATPTPTAAPAAAQPAAAPIDLLSTVPAAVAVSSVYQDRQSLAAKLVDGAIDTAWNSRSGDLAGAWIEVRLPAAVTVTSIEMTAGFTRDGGRTDLFTGNHRVSRVRVLRDGAEVGLFPLSTSSRELQRLPVTGGGGIWRVEIVDVLPGSRDDWREVCVSELRVMGHAAGALEGERFPRVGVGALPELPPERDPGSATFEGPNRDVAVELSWFDGAWARHEARVIMAGSSESAQPDPAALAAGRAEIFARVADLVAPFDAERAARLRSDPGTDARWEARRQDLDVLASALQAVVEARDDGGLRCELAQTLAYLRLNRAQTIAEAESSYLLEVELPLEASEAAHERHDRASDAALEVAQQLDDLLGAWLDGAPAAALRLRRARAPSAPRVRAEWDALLRDVRTAQRACDWTG